MIKAFRAVVVFVTALLLLGCADEQPLVLQTVTPSSGPLTGGTAVVLHGEGFTDEATVSFGGVPAASVEFVDWQTLNVVTPPHEAGQVDVTVSNESDSSTLVGAFTFLPDVTAAACTATVSPTFAALDVDVVAPIHIEFSEPIQPSSLNGAIRVTRAGNATDIPFTQTVDSPTGVTLTPAASFAFFEDYLVSVSGVVTLDDGSPCSHQSAFSTREPTASPRPLRPGPATDIAIVGSTLLVASSTYRGIQVYDVSTPAAPVLLRDLVTEGTPRGIAVETDRAYVPAGGYGVYIFDVSNPTEPALIGVAGTPGDAAEVVPFTRSGTRYLAVADRSGGFRLLDVTQAEGVADVAILQPNGQLQGDVFSIALHDQLAVAALGEDGFAVIDLSSVDDPVVLSVTPAQALPDTFNASRAVSDVALDGSTLYVALRSFGVQAFDVSTPSAPFFLDHVVGPQGLCAAGCPDEIDSLEVQDGILYASSAMTGATRISLTGADLSLDATLPVPGRVSSVMPDGTNLWVGGERGLALFEAAAVDGSAPMYAEASGWGVAQGILVRNQYLYIATSSRGLETYAISDPLSPSLLSLSTTGGAEADVGLLSIQSVGNLLVIGDGRAGISVFDATNPAAPSLAGTIPTADTVGAMAPGEQRLFACAGTQVIWTVDLSDPNNPTYAEIPVDAEVGGCYGMTIVGSKLYVAGALGLGVYDVTGATPSLLNSLVLPADDLLMSITARGTFLYATTLVKDFEGTHGTSQRLVVFDISDADNPTRVFKSDDLGGVADLLSRGDKLFVAGREQGVSIWGLADPADPQLEGLVELPGSAFRLAYEQQEADVLYVAQRGGGVAAIRLGSLASTAP